MPDGGTVDCASKAEVAALRRRVAPLEVAVAQLSRRHQAERDPRLAATLALIHRYAHATTWTAGQLLRDAGRDDRALWDALDAICGPGGDPPQPQQAAADALSTIPAEKAKQIAEAIKRLVERTMGTAMQALTKRDEKLESLEHRASRHAEHLRSLEDRTKKLEHKG